MLTENQRLVFFSYAKADEGRVVPYYHAIRLMPWTLWMDKFELKGGQNWELEIDKAIQGADIVLIFVSRASIDHRGYLQKEIRRALEVSKTKLVDDIFIIPVMLDDIPIPSQLTNLQSISTGDGHSVGAIIDAISFQFTRLETERTIFSEEHALGWSLLPYIDAWEGLPGYEGRCEFIQLASTTIPRLQEINEVVKGWLNRQIMLLRGVIFAQEPGLDTFPEGAYWRTNTLDARCNVSLVNKLISIEYTVYKMRAAAAHGMTTFKIFNFILNPTVYIDKVETIFKSSRVRATGPSTHFNVTVNVRLW